MTNIIMAIAIMGILLTLGLIVLARKQHLLDEELEIIESKETPTADLEAKIERLLAVTEKLADDYALIDEMQKQDRRDLIDIKKRYILYRPSNGAGVPWASEYRCKDDEGENND